MNFDIKLHKNDLPDDLELGNVIAVDGEFMGLNVKRDPLCLIQISTGNSDAHIIQLDRSKYDAPNLIKILENNKIKKIFHYGRADLAHIKYYLKTETKNILSTNIGSSNDFIWMVSCRIRWVVIKFFRRMDWRCILCNRSDIFFHLRGFK